MDAQRSCLNQAALNSSLCKAKGARREEDSGLLVALPELKLTTATEYVHDSKELDFLFVGALPGMRNEKGSKLLFTALIALLLV